MARPRVFVTRAHPRGGAAPCARAGGSPPLGRGPSPAAGGPAGRRRGRRRPPLPPHRPRGRRAAGRAPNLRVVRDMAVGYDNVDVPACTARRVAVGEHARRPDGDDGGPGLGALDGGGAAGGGGGSLHARGKVEDVGPDAAAGPGHPHATLGIVGLGRIGAEVARRGRGFDMRILYASRAAASRSWSASWAWSTSRWRSCCAQSDFVSLHTPLTPETRGLIGRARTGADEAHGLPHRHRPRRRSWTRRRCGGPPRAAHRRRCSRRLRGGADRADDPLLELPERRGPPPHRQRLHGHARPDGADGGGELPGGALRRTAGQPDQPRGAGVVTALPKIPPEVGALAEDGNAAMALLPAKSGSGPALRPPLHGHAPGTVQPGLPDPAGRGSGRGGGGRGARPARGAIPRGRLRVGGRQLGRRLSDWSRAWRRSASRRSGSALGAGDGAGRAAPRPPREAVRVTRIVTPEEEATPPKSGPRLPERRSALEPGAPGRGGRADRRDAAARREARPTSPGWRAGPSPRPEAIYRRRRHRRRGRHPPRGARAGRLPGPRRRTLGGRRGARHPGARLPTRATCPVRILERLGFVAVARMQFLNDPWKPR